MPLPVSDYIGSAKDNLWIRAFLAEWQLDQKTGGGDASLANRLDRYSHDSPDSALALLVALSEAATEEQERLAISEGLEALLQNHGVTYWETINSLCSQVPEFRKVMAHVWGASLPKDLKRKVEMWRM